MSDFATCALPADRTVVAPDGSDVRVLLNGRAGGMAQFELAAGRVSAAVVHRTVEEIWYVVLGRGEMWRKQGAHEETVRLQPGTCLTIPRGTRFQFRSAPGASLSVVAVTMPCWPGDGEAVAVPGLWPTTGAPPLDERT